MPSDTTMNDNADKTIDLTPSQTKVQLQISGTSCASCVTKIEGALKQVAGVEHAEMNLVQRTATVSGLASTESLIQAVEALGYQARSMLDVSDKQLIDQNERADRVYYKRLLRDTSVALGLGIPLMVYGLFIGEMTVSTSAERLAWGIVGLATFAVMATSGRHFYLGGWKSIWSHTANMDTLIALGTGAAWLYSMVVVFFPQLLPEMARHVYFEATAMIIGLINLGLALEVKARGRTSNAIKRLIGLQAKTARVVRGDQEVDVLIEDVVLGDIVRIRPGDKAPVDGVVIEGRTNMDESMLTGEPIPVEKKMGDSVATGTLNKTGSILFKATRVGKHTALAQIIDMVKRAQNAKPSIGRLADVISGYFVPAIIIIAIISALVWLNFGPAPTVAFAVVSATTVLIIACPCALGLATPMSVMVGVGKAAEAGVLIRNGEALQTASKITAMVVDKTGTITLGEPKVTDVLLASADTKAQALQFATSLEAGSEHRLALAIVESAKEYGIKPATVVGFNAIAGHGIEGLVDDQRVYFGNERLMRVKNIQIGAYLEQAQALAQDAKTPIFLAVAGQLAAIIAVADPIKDDSIAAIQRLQANGLRVVMLTGDNCATAAAVAKKIGITEFYAEVLPQDKMDKIKALQMEGEIVGMTGDGINDAPALAMANVGFAIGTGTDVAIESSDITLMRGSLHGLADAIAVSKATLNNVKQNLFGAFIYNAIGVPIAAGILYPMFGLMLSPVIAGAAMAFSSLTVVLNANRLHFFDASTH